ncbi:MAG: AI-2E family transporter, partial [Acidimicrobiia bacterium]|nr:AI-2E family transporter [Acidimicrobiia bacterium]
MNQQDRERLTRHDWLRGVGVAAWSIVGIFVVIAVVAWAVYQVRIIWAPLIFAVLLVYLVKPLIDFLERFRLPRVAGGFLVYLVLGGVLVLIGVLIVPIISRQTVELVDQVPEVIDSTFNLVADVAASLNLPIELAGVDSISDELVGWFSD